jgi:DNA-binding beta-propeller fold protein YncE
MPWLTTSIRSEYLPRKRRTVFDRLTLLALVPLCLTACGSALAPSNPGQASNPAVLIGQGSRWQVVITAEPDPEGVTGLALDGHGHVYLSEYTNDRIAEYTLQGSLVRKWGTFGSGVGQLDGPAKLALDAIGNVYVTETGNNRIQKFSATGEPLAQWGGGQASAQPGKFNFPIGIAIDEHGIVYVADAANYRIQKLSPTGGFLAQWGSEGSEPGQFDVAYDVSLGAQARVYVSEPKGNDRLQVFSPGGAPIAQWGGSGSAPGKFNYPTGIAVDGEGNIYVDDTGNNRIEKLSPSGQYLAQWTGPTTAPFDGHSEITMDSQGDLYVSDRSLILRICVASGGCN